MKKIFVLVFITATLVCARPANDWGKPCFDGHCAYNLPASASPASGTLKIWGSANAITDITPAAGWVILDCSPHELVQDIRLVCKGDPMTVAGCDHLFQNSGPVDKVVRLPESCGSNSFARISKSWIPEDQSIPSSFQPQIVRRDGVQPQVKAISVDTNFGAIDTSKAGLIYFAVRAINVPGADSDFAVSPDGLQGRDGAAAFVEKGLEELSALNYDGTYQINMDQKLNLFNEEMKCPGPAGTTAAASAHVDVNAKAKGTLKYGFTAAGTSKNLDQFGAYAELDADLDGSIDLVADLTGTVPLKTLPVIPPITILPLQFPGVITLGPIFRVDAEAKAELKLAVALSAGLNFKIDKAKLFFPPSAGKNSGGGFSIKDTVVTLSAGPSVTATGTLEAHIIPKVHFGLTALLGSVSSGFFLELDTSGTLQLEGKASATGTNKPKRSYLPPYGLPYGALSSRSLASSDIVSARAQTNPENPDNADLAGAGTPTVSFSGCVDLKAGLNVNAGAEATFLKFFTASTKVPLFKHEFEIYKNCWPAGAKREMVESPMRRSSLETGLTSLTCPGSKVDKVSLVDKKTVDKKSIKQL